MTALAHALHEVPHQAGLARLKDRVRSAQVPARRAPSDACTALFDAELRVALEAADARRAAEAALALWRRSGDLVRCHGAISRVLAAVGEACQQEVLPTARANRIAATSARVIAALRDRTHPGTGGRVVLAAPENDHHGLSLESLAHVLEDAGFHADVCGPLAPHELAVAGNGAAGVVLSVHLRSAAVPALVAAARRSAPEGVIAIGGPAAVPVPEADLLSPELDVLVEALRLRR
jgi:methylmalonyl-CoA mutase cobalamin-binding subunit